MNTLKNWLKKSLWAMAKINKMYWVICWVIILSIFVFYGSVYAAGDIPERKIEEKSSVDNKTATSPIRKQAAEKTGVTDKIIGSTFKTLVKAFVATTDINELKKNNIAKINKMDEEKYQRRYAKVYEVIKDLPSHLKVDYEITEHMSKEQVIKHIELLDKKKAYKMIDSIPDTFIANKFKQYLSEKKQEFQKSNVVEQINQLWNKMLEKVGKKEEVK